MKFLQNLGLGYLSVVLTTSGLGLQAAKAEAEADKYAPLVAALVAKKQEVITEAEEALVLAEGYNEFLSDPETERDEKPALRRNLVRERARHEKLQEDALQIQAAIRNLRSVPDEKELTLPVLKEAYNGLDDLGAQGRAAWGQLLTDRDSSIETLQSEYDEAIAELTEALEALNTTEKANQILLNAIDSRRTEMTDPEFRVALKLPRIQSAVEFCFGLEHKPDDPDHQAQTTLLALISYSQFFWDHYSGARAHLSEDELPEDRARNVFGIADGEVLTSDAIVGNRSSIYYLSGETKGNFNRRLQAIWGSEGSVSVHRWDQKHARTFYGACETLSSREDSALRPDLLAFELFDEIDLLIQEKEEVALAIRETHRSYKERIANARKFGDRARLSSAHFNAEVLARESKQILARFEAARRILDGQLTESAGEDWTPNAKRITASATTLRRAQKRIRSVNKVKRELTTLLQ